MLHNYVITSLHVHVVYMYISQVIVICSVTIFCTTPVYTVPCMCSVAQGVILDFEG